MTQQPWNSSIPDMWQLVFALHSLPPTARERGSVPTALAVEKCFLKLFMHTVASTLLIIYKLSLVLNVELHSGHVLEPKLLIALSKAMKELCKVSKEAGGSSLFTCRFAFSRIPQY